MGLFTRKPRRIPFDVPRLDDPVTGRGSFAARTLYEMGHREAFEPEAHDVADMLLDPVLARVPLDVAADDEPYLRQLFASAAQDGAGIGIVERRAGEVDEFSVDRDIAGALAEAVDRLPAMPREHRRIATLFVHAGHYVARSGPEAVEVVLAALPEA
ncbi:MAG TPA: hypothetical protein VIW24_06700 [Aldersonia sp.]